MLFRSLTSYVDGEQVYNPKWSPGGKQVLFDFSDRDARSIRVLSLDGNKIAPVVEGSYDARNAVFSPDGSRVIYACDTTGIFNLYEYDTRSHAIRQLTNVLGGAFMPTVNSRGQIAYAAYTSTGYKIAFIDSALPTGSYLPYVQKEEPGQQTYLAFSGTDGVGSQQFDWKKLRAFDDTKLPSYVDTTYENIASSLTFVPLVRVDNYNPKSTGLDLLKLGLYAFSYDMLDR